jgi:hypothetical protein
MNTKALFVSEAGNTSAAAGATSVRLMLFIGVSWSVSFIVVVFIAFRHLNAAFKNK